MCCRFNLTATPETIVEHFGLQRLPSYNIAPIQKSSAFSLNGKIYNYLFFNRLLGYFFIALVIDFLPNSV